MRYASLVLFTLSLFTTAALAQDDKAPIIGEWTLFSFKDAQNGSSVYPPTELHRPIKLYFQPDSNFNANSFRVYISGKYSINGEKIHISSSNNSKNLAENDLGEKFRTTFPKSAKFKVMQDTLVLHGAGDGKKLMFLRGNEKTDALYKEHTAMLATFEVPAVFSNYFAPARNEGFWVYKDEAKNSIQSLYLESFNNSYFRKGFSDHNREWMSSSIYSDNKKDPILSTQLYAFSEEEVILSFFLPGDGTSSTNRCLNKRKAFQLGDESIYTCDCQLELVPEVEVNGKKYKEVIKVTRTDAAGNKGLFQTAWFAPGIGLIRQDLADGTSMKLVRYTTK